MLAWSFSARTAEEVASLLRALGRHRYLREVSYALHWSVDEALSQVPAWAPVFGASAAAFRARRQRERELDVSSRDPSLWRQVSLDEVIAALSAFWIPGDDAALARQRLGDVLTAAELALADHAPWGGDPEDTPHPELVLIDWELWSIDALDSERHAGALAALEAPGEEGEEGEEVDVGAAVYAEPGAIAYPELAHGAPNGVLVEDFWVWCDGDYHYVDYVFRGVAKAAKLVDPPVGPRDLEWD